MLDEVKPLTVVELTSHGVLIVNGGVPRFETLELIEGVSNKRCAAGTPLLLQSLTPPPPSLLTNKL